MNPFDAKRRRIPTPGHDDRAQWMGRLNLLTDEELDALLAGRTAEGQRDLGPLADVAATIRSRARAEPAPVMGYELRRAMAAGSARPARQLHRRAVEVVAAAAAVFTLGAVSAAGALPATLQNAVSNAGHVVGLTLPRAEEAHEHARGSAAIHVGEPEDEGTEVKVAGPPSVTPGGATPADPGTPQDQEPADPATPPEPSNGGQQPATMPTTDLADDPGSTADERGATTQDDADERGASGEAGRDRRPEQPTTPTTADDKAREGSNDSEDSEDTEDPKAEDR